MTRLLSLLLLPEPGARAAGVPGWAFAATMALGLVALALLIRVDYAFAIADTAFFHADDWGWLTRSAFTRWYEGVTVFPKSYYNNRPVGALIINGLYHIHGLDYEPYARLWLFTHWLNCVLLFAIAHRYAGLLTSWAVSAICAVWFVSNAAVYWVAAVFDLFGATFALASVYFAVSAVRHSAPRVRLLLMAASVVTAFLCIRTKEFGLAVPGVVTLFVFYEYRFDLRRTLRTAAPHLALLSVFMAVYAYLVLQPKPVAVDPTAYDYELVFDLGVVASNFLGQVKSLLYIDLWGHASVASVVATALLVLACLATATWPARILFVFSWICVAALLGPTLLLDRGEAIALYLYAPHFFAALSIAALAGRRELVAAQVEKSQRRVLTRSLATPAASLAILALGNHVVDASNFKANRTNYHRLVTERSAHHYQSILDRLGELQNETGELPDKVEIYTVSLAGGALNYGNGAFARIALDNRTLSVLGAPASDQSALKARYCESAAPVKIFGRVADTPEAIRDGVGFQDLAVDCGTI